MVEIGNEKSLEQKPDGLSGLLEVANRVISQVMVVSLAVDKIAEDSQPGFVADMLFGVRAILNDIARDLLAGVDAADESSLRASEIRKMFSSN
jgi:hypothetical protein